MLNLLISYVSISDFTIVYIKKEKEKKKEKRKKKDDALGLPPYLSPQAFDEGTRTMFFPKF